MVTTHINELIIVTWQLKLLELKVDPKMQVIMVTLETPFARQSTQVACQTKCHYNTCMWSTSQKRKLLELYGKHRTRWRRICGLQEAYL